MKCDRCGKDIGSRIMYIPKEDRRIRKAKNLKTLICSSCCYKYDNTEPPRYSQIFLTEEEYDELNNLRE